MQRDVLSLMLYVAICVALFLAFRFIVWGYSGVNVGIWTLLHM